MNILPSTLSMGAVSLRVANVEATLDFYTRGVGLEVLESLPGGYVLGHGPQASIVLEHQPSLKHASSGEAGLFHTALLFATRADLALAVSNVANNFPRAFTGSANHLVSEAFYFNDPEQNGVELYFDLPRSEWVYESGQLQMATLPLDPNRFLAENLSMEASSASSVGHVHLSVGDIAQANHFYVGVLGFETTVNWANTALFVSAGGYHHHMAMNIWRSRGAGVRQQVLGLGDLTLKLGNEEALIALKDRAKFHSWSFQDDGAGLKLNDPWGNRVIVQA